MTWICPCTARNADKQALCENCGDPRPALGVMGAGETKPASCPVDGALLMANGWCELGAGYPITRACPFVCDRCREPLTWAGTCNTCRQYAPGDRWESGDDQHWRLTEPGPIALCTPEENLAHAKAFVDLITRLTATTRLEL